MDKSFTFSFCACESESVSDARLCADVSSLSLDPDLPRLLWNERSGGVLNDGRMNYLHLYRKNSMEKNRLKKGGCTVLTNSL